MSEEVTKIIDALCDKLGVAATYLIPELAKKSIAQDVVSIVIAATIRNNLDVFICNSVFISANITICFEKAVPLSG